MAASASKIIYVILPRFKRILSEVPKTYIAKLDAGTTPLVNEKLVVYHAAKLNLFSCDVDDPYVEIVKAKFDVDNSNSGVIFDIATHNYIYFTVVS